jgi:PTH1 family peptidyl-tRNA hydrolase
LSELHLIAGLGNPGCKYAETRHNAGFWFLDRLAGRCGASLRLQTRLQAEVARVQLHGQDCVLCRPTTFMNHSGLAIRAVSDYFRVPVSRLLVAYDELDLPVGVSRLRQGGGHGGHNGLRDIFRHMPDHDFLRLRIGIGHPGSKEAVTGYVLGRPSADEERLMRESIEEAIAVLPDVLGGQLSRAMKSLHTRADAS